LDGTQPEAQLTSALSVGMPSAVDLPMAERRLGRFLFLNEKTSAREWTERHYQRMADELETYRPAVLEANPSWLARLAWWALDRKRSLYQPEVVLFTYEFISAIHLAAIRRVFRVPLISSYGATETGYVFMECEHGTLHQNTEFCRVDFQPVKPEHGGPSLGRLLVTTFQNPWTSLIRFDVGDLGRLDERPTCPCGRGEGYRLTAIEGRAANATFTTAGRLVTTHQLDQTLARVDGVRDYHLEQVSPQAYRLDLMLGPGAPADASGQAGAVLQTLYGPGAEVSVYPGEDIAPGPSGKYRRTQTAFNFNPEDLFA
jgi:phenylacetate-CoA ligase